MRLDDTESQTSPHHVFQETRNQKSENRGWQHMSLAFGSFNILAFFHMNGHPEEHINQNFYLLGYL